MSLQKVWLADKLHKWLYACSVLSNLHAASVLPARMFCILPTPVCVLYACICYILHISYGVYLSESDEVKLSLQPCQVTNIVHTQSVSDIASNSFQPVQPSNMLSIHHELPV